MARNDTQANFRVKPELMDWLKGYAKENYRSITAQFNLILEQERERQTQDNKKADCTVESNQSASETTI